MLYWSGASTELLSELCKENLSSVPHRFFWMALLNDSSDLQPLFDRTLEGLKENHAEHILEFVSMMVKAKRDQEILKYLTDHDHVE